MPTPFRVGGRQHGSHARTSRVIVKTLGGFIIASWACATTKTPNTHSTRTDGRISFLIFSPSSAEFPFGFQNDGKCTPNSSVRQHCEIDLDVQCPELSRFVMNIAISRNIKGAHFAVGCDCPHHHLPKGAPL